MTVTELPSSGSEPARWQPTRAGIVNVWRYYDETFEFHRGRLLLRGPNGTGKSKALELLLPFLFDANLRANRLSTFGSSERSMHWNLMGEGATGVTRVGYVWLEFTRQGRWFCCGARLQASTRTSAVHADYFTTDQRIGTPDGLSLVNDSGQPLTRAALAEELGDRGQLHASASEYRTTLRTTLFEGLSEQRYESLITALLQLRTPKLSERLDPALLSELLSRALPPLGQAEITELAEGFERLDRQRERLARLDEEVGAAETLADRQRTYAQRVLRSSAAELISATTELDNLARTARESEQRYQEAVTEQAEVEQRRQERDASAEELRAHIEGLTESESYKQGRELDRLRSRSTEAEQRAASLRSTAESKQHTADEDAERAEAAESAADSAAAAMRAAENDSHRSAERAGMTSAHEEVSEALRAGRAARPLLRAAVHGRRDRIDTVRRALDSHDAAVRERDLAECELEQTRTELAQATERRDEATRAHETAIDQQAQRLREWARDNTELRVDDVEELASSAANRAAVLDHVHTASRQVADILTSRESGLSTRRASLTEQRTELVAELDRLREETDMPPGAPVTRTTDRSELPGAPLWKLVAFADGVDERSRAGVEAALQAAGLLDAWVSPDGRLTPSGHDTFLKPDHGEEVDGRSLTEVLRPEADQPVATHRTHSVLAGIAYGEHLPTGHAAIGADGSWRLAGATGSWEKPEVAHIGAAARERARQRRVDELAGHVAEADARVAELDTELSTIDRRRRRLDEERRALPDSGQVEEADNALTRAEATVAARDDAVSQRTTQVSNCEHAADRALRRLTTTAAENSLPAERAALDRLETGVTGFYEVAETWLDAAAESATSSGAATSARDSAQRSRAIAEERRREVTEADQQASRLAATLHAVESTVGTDYQQVLAEMDQARERLRQARDESETLGGRLRELDARVGELGNQRTVDSQHRDSAVETRDAAMHRFRRITTGSLPVDAGVDLEVSASDSVRTTLETARSVAAKWPKVPHTAKNLTDALGRLSESMHTCRQVLAERADLAMEPDEDVQVFVATMDGVRVGAARLLEALRDERDRGREDITAAERKLFDQTLTGDTRRHLAARIRQANELVDAMNARLQRVRTASNVAVRLVWRVDPGLPAGTQAARELLLKDPVRLTDEDKESLHRFFRERIEEAKADNTAASWEAQLTRVFDYTAWHRFEVHVDRGGGSGWQRLTKKLHGALSGGEKAIALHLPLFAAVAAHYESVPEAPRLILLDEVFVGVDTTNRGQVFDLLSALELDLVLTSDHEWCTYPELDGIAVHQLITGDGDDAVTTARFVWDGHGWSEGLPDAAASGESA